VTYNENHKDTETQRHRGPRSRTFIRAPLCLCVSVSLWFSCMQPRLVSAQVGPGGLLGAATGPAEGAQANPLPLSGRSGQTGSVRATQLPVPGTTTSVNTINPTVQVQGPYGGSAQGPANALRSGMLSFREAIQRGLEYNLGAVDQMQAVRQARGQSIAVRSTLLPNLNGYTSETVQQVNLRAFGVRVTSPVPGFSIPTIVGPFNFFDLRATLTQTVMDRTALNNYRSSAETLRANQFFAEDSRDLVVLAVGGAYLQVIAAKTKVDSARAQLETANALYQQALEHRSAGVIALTDVNRSQIQALTEQQRLLSLENDLAKQKINLARMTGLPLGVSYDVSDVVPFSAAPPMDLDSALKLALEQRADLRAAEAQVRAAERALSAARDERLPSLSVRADYGVIGTNPAQSHGTFAVSGRLNFPIWQGGRIAGNIEQAEAVLAQREAEREDIVGQIESDVRNAYLDLHAAASQVEVALKNIQVTQENLDLTRQRFDAGVSDNVGVVQSQESLATAHSDYINSVFAHNLAKLALARATGDAAENLPRFLNVQ
jgi:outer membrane protein TolC